MHKILIVDDDPLNLRMLELTLTKADYAVVKASDGTEAIKLAKGERPDLIICDVMMPDVDGGEVAQNLEDDPTTQAIPVIFLTGLLQKSEEASHTMVAGRRYLAKPYESNKLLNLISAMIAERGKK